MVSYEQIFRNNEKWAAQKKANDSAFFDKLAREQNPDYLYIGCSDSRVTAEEMMGAGPGEVFVHRNIANVVSNNDLNVLSVIEFAIKQLSVKHVIVCGHYNCSGIKAAMQSVDLGLLNPWLRNVRDVYRLYQQQLDAILNTEERYRLLVELNVKEQCMNVIKTAALQHGYLKNGYPVVHGWIMDIESGKLIDLQVDFIGLLRRVQEIYDLSGITTWRNNFG
ncbi:MAG TPA: carbonic anhydrase [Saprospiraceae bacterium]|nr:carbonic anhydrase [Saprospiraceae bacterium]